MLRNCLPHQQELSFYHTNTMLDTSCIFSQQTEPPRQIDVWPRNGSVGVICLSQEHNNALLSLGAVARFGTLAVANLRYFLLSCTDAIVGILALSVFSKSTKVYNKTNRGIKLATLQLIFCDLTDLATPPLSCQVKKTYVKSNATKHSLCTVSSSIQFHYDGLSIFQIF